jgi:hypothetical protein
MHPSTRLGRRRKIALSNGLYTLVDRADYEHLSKFRWHAVRSRRVFYAARSIKTALGYGKMFMHNEILGIEKNADHINRCPLINCRWNLRASTLKENNWNQGKRQHKDGHESTSRFKGVFLDRTAGRYKAQILHEGKRLSLGYFDKPEEAARAYDRKCLELRGPLAVLNFTLHR